jgi:hypothetical protein
MEEGLPPSEWLKRMEGLELKERANFVLKCLRESSIQLHEVAVALAEAFAVSFSVDEQLGTLFHPMIRDAAKSILDIEEKVRDFNSAIFKELQARGLIEKWTRNKGKGDRSEGRG